MTEPEMRADAHEDYVLQDGVRWPKKPPWGPRVWIIVAAPLALIFVVAVVVLFKTSLVSLLVMLLAAGVITVQMMYMVCTRCPYYGRDCFFLRFGRIVPLIFKKQEGKSMVPGMWLSMLIAAFLFVYPIPGMWAYGGWIAVALWVILFALFFVMLSRVACPTCPFASCPYRKAGKAVWHFVEGK